MALGDSYIDLDTLKDYLKIKPEKLENDEILTDAINSASREIDRMCNRQFNKADTATPRVYTPTSTRRYGYLRNKVLVDDFYTTDDLLVELDVDGNGTYSYTVPSTDYELYPSNGIVDGAPGWPFYELHLLNDMIIVPNAPWRVRASVRVTAKWGWESVPAPIKSACLIIAAESYQLKDAPFGVAGMDQFGNVFHVRDNRIAAGKVARYTRHRIPVG
jgi:hypothetical protein